MNGLTEVHTKRKVTTLQVEDVTYSHLYALLLNGKQKTFLTDLGIRLQGITVAMQENAQRQSLLQEVGAKQMED